MNAVFADSSYYIALLVPTDSAHQRAMELTAAHRGTVITSAWILMELGSFFSPVVNRQLFLQLAADLRSSHGVIIIDPDQKWIDAGIKLYAERLDKAWSLVDCISFLIMQEYQLTDAWTSDHHFVQAGYNALMI